MGRWRTHGPVLGLMLMVGVAVGFVACGEAGEGRFVDGWDTREPLGSQDWLRGDLSEKLETLASQMQGFSRAMQEVGYRYNELYFAGQDGNWELARYHAEKIVDAIELGIERRPARGESAQPFLNEVMPQMLETIEAGDGEAFELQFERVRNNCNACHEMEDMDYLVVRTPRKRLFAWGSMDEYEDGD